MSARIVYRLSKNKRGPRGHPLSLKPPAFESNVSVTRTYRFLSSGTSASLTPRTLLTAAGTYALTAILGTSVFSAVKLGRIRIWTPPTSTGTASTCSIVFPTSGNVGNAHEYSDSSMNPTVPAFIDISPPPNTLASFWNTDATTVLATLTAPTGSIIDIHLKLILNDASQTAPPFNLVTVGNTPTLIYYYPADGRGGIFTPVSLTPGG